jgi:hypothetical protein
MYQADGPHGPKSSLGLSMAQVPTRVTRSERPSSSTTDPAEYARAKRAEAAAKAIPATPLAAAGLSPFALSIAQQRLGIDNAGDLARADVQWAEGEKPASVRDKKALESERTGPSSGPQPPAETPEDLAREVVARATGLPEDEVTVHLDRLGSATAGRSPSSR